MARLYSGESLLSIFLLIRIIKALSHRQGIVNVSSTEPAAFHVSLKLVGLVGRDLGLPSLVVSSIGPCISDERLTIPLEGHTHTIATLVLHLLNHLEHLVHLLVQLLVLLIDILLELVDDGALGVVDPVLKLLELSVVRVHTLRDGVVSRNEKVPLAKLVEWLVTALELSQGPDDDLLRQ